MPSGTPQAHSSGAHRSAADQRSSATKVLDVLTALSDHPGPHRLTDLALSTGLAKATVYRMLQSLVERGFVVTGPGSRYAIGPRFLGIANAALVDAPWHKIVRSGLEQLRAATGMSAHFAQPYGKRTVIVDSAESTDPFGLPARPGRSDDVTSTAFGQALDGHDAVLADDRDDPGVRSIAAPVFGADGQVLGAIGVAGTTFTLSDDATIDRISDLVTRTAGESSAVLGAYRRRDGVG
ncbi:IclR family transcriptional regulator [Microlunatus soli]|uniref:Glycerol operon regulatory protein n=1 Tax=Microlunatus soli TaxID=630515 RepID=A0A1H1ZK61_9ACTN|nr:helix-turn-helix domain-containing protein [Microlunatus soli]SDT34054.1 DNA-binding transcriptional regulator, IclR family [Microlunatus soli]